MTDKRRFGVIEVTALNAETYHLVIDGQSNGRPRANAGASKTPAANA